VLAGAGSLVEAVAGACTRSRGTYGIAVVSTREPDTIVARRRAHLFPPRSFPSACGGVNLPLPVSSTPPSHNPTPGGPPALSPSASGVLKICKGSPRRKFGCHGASLINTSTGIDLAPLLRLHDLLAHSSAAIRRIFAPKQVKSNLGLIPLSFLVFPPSLFSPPHHPRTPLLLSLLFPSAPRDCPLSSTR